MSTAFQPNAFQNNAFQIVSDLASTIGLTFTVTADLTILFNIEAEVDLLAITVGSATLIDFNRLSARPGLTFSVDADLTVIEMLEALVTLMTFNMTVDEGWLRDEIELVASTINPPTVIIQQPAVEAVTLVAEAVNPVTATIYGIPAETIIPEPASIAPDGVTLVRL